MRMRPTTYPWLLLMGLFLLFTQCKKNKKDDQAPMVEVRLKLSEPLTGSSAAVEYFVFDNEQDYLTTTKSRTPSKFLASGTMINGQLTIPGLLPSHNYYVYVRYFDETTFPGFSLLYTNEESTFLIPTLPAQSIVNGLLKLKPQDGLVTFEPSSVNGTLDIRGKGIEPFLLENTPKTLLLRKGSYQFNTKSTSIGVCTWVKEQTIAPGAKVSILHELCEAGQVVFYTEKTENLAVEVFIGINENVGAIKAIGQPTSCSDTNLPHTTLLPGTYSYHASKATTNCAWMGTFTVTKGVCTKIVLDACQK